MNAEQVERLETVARAAHSVAGEAWDSQGVLARLVEHYAEELILDSFRPSVRQLLAVAAAPSRIVVIRISRARSPRAARRSQRKRQR